MIDVKLLKSVIVEQVNDLVEKLNGNMEPSINKYEALRALGTISSLVIGLYDRVEDEMLKEEIWQLKKEADDLYQKLMDF